MQYTRAELRFQGRGFRRGIVLEGTIAGQAAAAIVHTPVLQVTHTLVTARRAASLPDRGVHQLGSGRTELPSEYVRVTGKTAVRAGNSSVARVSRLWCDRHSGLLTHILVRPPSAFLQRALERVVTADLVGTIRPDGVQLKLSRSDLLHLPVYQTDDAILAGIQLAFESALPDPRARREVKVRVDDGLVTLSGSVDAAEQLERARRTAAAIQGVRGLTVDLVVQETLAQAVEGAIAGTLAEYKLSPANVRAFTEHGIVYLEGRVTTPDARAALERAALSVRGVLVVVNNLAVEGEPPERARETGPLTRNR